MSENTSPGAIPPGWYPDPSGDRSSRWWDGAAWTDQIGPPVAGLVQNPQQLRPQLGPGVSVSTVFIWIIVLLPLLGIPLGFFYHPTFKVIRITPGGMKTIDPASLYTIGYFINVGISLVFYGLTVLLAFLDRRVLIRRGVVRPFHWAWAFLYSPVYVIGRSVIVHRVAPKRGLWPLWVYIAVLVIGFVIGGIRSAALFHSLY